MRKPKANRYLWAAIIAVGVIVCNQIFIQYWLYQKTEDAKIINISGRQRMLSQTINLEFERVYRNQGKSTEAGNIFYLKRYFQEWEVVHQTLQFGNDSLQIQAVSSQEILLELEKLNPRLDYIKKKIQYIEAGQKLTLSDIYLNQAIFLKQMNDIVNMLEKESDAKLNFIIYMEIFLAIISIIVILVEIRWVYIPIHQNLRNVIRELKKSQYNLRAVHESSLVSLTFISPDFKILYANRKSKDTIHKLFGKYLHTGDSILELHEPELREELETYLRRALTGENIQVERFTNTTWWLLIFYPVYDEKELIIGIGMIRQDIIRIKKRDAILKTRTEKLEQIAWEQSHVIRSPLANILGIMDLITNYEISKEDRVIFLEMLEKETQRLDNVIHSIVDLTDVKELDIN